MPTSAKRRMVSARASRPPMPRCRRNTSSTCRPTRRTGLSAVMGSWKIMAMWGPRRRRRWRAERPRTSTWPRGVCSRMRPDARAPSGRSPMTALAVRLLPQPDSPTRQTMPPRGTARERSWTARNGPSSPEKLTVRRSRRRASVTEETPAWRKRRNKPFRRGSGFPSAL